MQRPRSSALLLALLALACSAEPEVAEGESEAPTRAGPPTARWDKVDRMRERLAQPRHPSDGGGRARLIWRAGEPRFARVATPQTFSVEYEVGPKGIARGGHILFRPSPLVGGWSRPQLAHPDRRGFTTVEAVGEGIELQLKSLNTKAILVWVTGRPLVAGDRIRFTYGAGPSRALAGRYAQKNARFWIAVDGDGDGAHRYLVASPGVEVRPGPAAVLLVTVPSTARPGEEVPVRIALLDARRNAGPPVRGEVTFEAIPPGVEMPSRVELEPADAGRALVFATLKAPGVYRLRARAGPLAGVSNPLVVSENGARVLWGDLHGHSASSDGTGTPGDYFRYARDVAGLDVVALTDHDHLGMLPLDEYPDLGQEIARETRRFHEPGRFVTLPGYEWTSWIYGHRHVLYFDGDGPLLSSVDPAFATPAQLWKGLAGRAALTFAHHSAGGPIATDWSIPPDPVFEPVTEIVSVHGSSEAADAPGVIHRAVDGNFVRDALAMGYRFGFIGSGDTHDGHPGVTHIGYPSGGLAAIASESLTREGVLEALRTRRVYATNGRRILLRATLGGHAMGSTIPVPGAALALRAEVAAVAPLERLDVIRSGEVVASLPAQGQLDFSVRREIGDLRPGEYLYVRAVQEDGGAAWSSPFFVE